jgi:hypothetical protein
MRANGPTAAERPEKAVGMRELVDERLRLDDFRDHARGLGDAPEGIGMRPGVVADPVAFGVRALRERAALAARELRAEDEERRLDARGFQDVQDAVGDGRLGAVVEGQGDLQSGRSYLTSAAARR